MAMSGRLPFAIIGFVLLASVLAFVHSARGPAKSEIATSEAHTRVPVEGAEPSHAIGPTDAPVILEEFGDFQCPACSKLYPLLKAIQKEYAPRVRVVFREFPLAQHRKAILAAGAAEAAGMQGRFWEMHDVLYEDASSWTKASDAEAMFADYAHKLGMDQERFRQDLMSPEIKHRITLDRARGTSLGVVATPTVYLNGNEIPYAHLKTIEGLRSDLDQALKPKV